MSMLWLPLLYAVLCTKDTTVTVCICHHHQAHRYGMYQVYCIDVISCVQFFLFILYFVSFLRCLFRQCSDVRLVRWNKSTGTSRQRTKIVHIGIMFTFRYTRVCTIINQPSAIKEYQQLTENQANKMVTNFVIKFCWRKAFDNNGTQLFRELFHFLMRLKVI